MEGDARGSAAASAPPPTAASEAVERAVLGAEEERKGATTGERGGGGGEPVAAEAPTSTTNAEASAPPAPTQQRNGGGPFRANVVIPRTVEAIAEDHFKRRSAILRALTDGEKSKEEYQSRRHRWERDCFFSLFPPLALSSLLSSSHSTGSSSVGFETSERFHSDCLKTTRA